MESVITSSAAAAGVVSPLELAWSTTVLEDWEAQVRASYKPLQLTDDLWIVPDWCAHTAGPCCCIKGSPTAPLKLQPYLLASTASSVREKLGQEQGFQLSADIAIELRRAESPDPSKTNILLKPGLAFGTGEHATTRLCLKWLQGAELSGKRVVDYGCGSGILSVAACLYGAAHVVRC